jgi:hypothetical protein
VRAPAEEEDEEGQLDENEEEQMEEDEADKAHGMEIGEKERDGAEDEVVTPSELDYP